MAEGQWRLWSGKFLVGGPDVVDGKWAVHSDCCCTDIEAGEPCDCCEGDTPLTYLCTFADILACPQCRNNDAGAWFKPAVLPNEAVTLTQLAAPSLCVWRGIIADGLAVDWYADSDCLNFTDRRTYDVDVELAIVAGDPGGWLKATATSDDFPAGEVRLFFNWTGDCWPNDCMGEGNVVNNANNCAVGAQIGTGGTGTFEPV